jgi:hypothetical protein
MNLDLVTLPLTTPDREREEERFGSFAEQLLTPARGRDGWMEDGRRLGTGLGLAALFGGALGLRVGGAGLLPNALGAAAGLIAVAAVAVPSLAIALALANVPVDARALGRATSRAVAKAGLVLAGLAPAALLYTVTVEDGITVTIVGFGSLLLAGAIAVASFRKDLEGPMREAPARTMAMQVFAIPAFVIFAATLALRVWFLTFPILAGAR